MSATETEIVGNEPSSSLLRGIVRDRFSYCAQMACFVMFFVASLSLGYQTLSRYDPRLGRRHLIPLDWQN